MFESFCLFTMSSVSSPKGEAARDTLGEKTPHSVLSVPSRVLTWILRNPIYIFIQSCSQKFCSAKPVSFLKLPKLCSLVTTYIVTSSSLPSQPPYELPLDYLQTLMLHPLCKRVLLNPRKLHA